MRLNLSALALLTFAAPAFAADERPEYQILEGIEGCIIGAGEVDETEAVLTPYEWKLAEGSDHGISEFVPAIGEETFIYMSHGVDFCQVESTTLGTTYPASMLELFILDDRGGHGLTITATGTDAEGCATTTLSNGVVATITSGGNDPTCTSETDSAVRFVFPS
jgi:hypothetical protein